MLGLLAAAYLLLAVRVRIGFDISLIGTRGSLKISAGAVGVTACFDGEIRRDGLRLTVLPRYSAPKKSGEKEKRRAHRMIRMYFRLARRGRMERLMLEARLGLGDAGETAVAAGSMQALTSALFLRYGKGAESALRIMPDYGGACFVAHGQCIFSCYAGDIMLAVLSAAVSKIRKEGFWWKSTPLKA